MSDAYTNPRRALGAFLRARRELLPSPSSVPIRRRRTPGLRREEVAEACGVSATWYTWLEQGRDVSASPAALARMAGVLRLSRAERAYMFDLAGKRDPAETQEFDDDIPLSALALPNQMAVPAYLLDRSWTARAWNAAAADLFAGWLDAEADRNLLRYIFLSPVARGLIADWEERGRRVVAEFRADYSRCLRDPALRGLIRGAFRTKPSVSASLERAGGPGPRRRRETVQPSGRSPTAILSKQPRAHFLSGDQAGHLDSPGRVKNLVRSRRRRERRH